MRTVVEVGYIAQQSPLARRGEPPCPSPGPPVVAARSKTRRVPIDGAEPGKRGKMPTRVVRATESTVSFDALSRFPSGVRVELGLTSCYTDKTLPFPHALE